MDPRVNCGFVWYHNEVIYTGRKKWLLKCIKMMYPYYHYSDHFLYAKSCHFIFTRYDWYERQTCSQWIQVCHWKGFTISRPYKFWCCLWSDMTIEQTPVRFMKTAGGLTQVRGISDSTMAKWILTMNILVEVSKKIKEFFNLSFSLIEQPLDARNSRISRDEAAVQKLVNWFSSHFPFPNCEHLMWTLSGIVADESIRDSNGL